PELVALLLGRGPAEVAAAIVTGDLLDDRDLLGDAGGGPVKLEEQCRRDLVVEFRVLVDRVDLRLVQEFYARHRNAGLDRRDDGADRRLDRRKGAYRGRHRLGDAVEPERHFGDDAERSLRADEQPGQVVAGR